jgi:hypothetical protein
MAVGRGRPAQGHSFLRGKRSLEFCTAPPPVANCTASGCNVAAYDCINVIRLNLCGCMVEASGVKLGAGVVDILLTLIGMLIAFVIASWSCAKSYFEKGRVRGMEEATREIMRGVRSHYELDSQAVPEPVAKALELAKAVAEKGRKTVAGTTDPYHAQLWRVGDAIGDACWLKGHAAGMRRKAPAEGKIRVDLSLSELLQLSWLANLGFQYMMPNYRGFEVHRFSDAEDAREGATAVTRIESAIPAEDRPFDDLSLQRKSRQKLISDWWQVGPDRLTA